MDSCEFKDKSLDFEKLAYSAALFQKPTNKLHRQLIPTTATHLQSPE